MNKFFNTFFTLGLVITLILSLSLSTSVVNEYSYNDFDLPKIKSQETSETSTTSYSRADENIVNLIVSKNRMINITSDRTYKNVTIRDDATLNIEGCNVNIEGKLKVIGNGRLFIRNSNVTVAPGPIGAQEIVINFSDNAKVRIEKSNIFTFPQPTLTNISYLLSDDASEVIIINSVLNLKLPAILHMDIELTPPTAGTFILTGDTVWNIQNSKVEGFLKFDNKLIFILSSYYKQYLENGTLPDTLRKAFERNEIILPSNVNISKKEEKLWEIANGSYIIEENEGHFFVYIPNTLLGRWFLFTLQGNAELYMKNSYGYINDGSQPFIKPVAGYVMLENCYIIEGVIDVEVVAEFEAINLSIEDLNIRDQTKSRIIRSNIENTLDLGSVAIIPSEIGYLGITEITGEEPKSTLYLEDTKIGNTFIAQGNSTSEIINSDIKICSISSGAKIHFKNNCSVKTLIEAGDNSTLLIENTSIPTINLAENCKLDIYQIPGYKPVNKITTHFNCQSDISLHGTEVRSIEIFGGDQVPPEEYGPWYEPDLNISKISIKMYESTLNKLKIEDDAQLYLFLQNSKIDEFDFKNYKNEKIIISLVDINSNFTYPTSWPDVDLEMLTFHKVGIETMVNTQPVKANIILKDSMDIETASKITDEFGTVELELLYEQYTSSGKTSFDEYSIIATYLGFTEVIIADNDFSIDYAVNWEDYNPPAINNIKIDTDFQRTKRGTRIQAKIIDGDIKVIANATIYYQYKITNGKWSTWKTSTMIEIGNNTYEGEIEQLDEGTQVKFYILVYDILGNDAQSSTKNYSIPNTSLFIIISFTLLLIVVLILMSLLVIKRKTKLKKYLNKHQSSKLGENDKNERK